MLQTMRDNAQGMIAKVIVFFIIVVFALFGVESIVSLGGGEQPKATVGDLEVSEVEILRIVEQQKNNLRRQFGDQYNEDLFNDGFLRQSAVEQLINQKVALVQAEKLGLHASSQAIDAQIVGMPAFQLDGKFSKEQFQNILRLNGWSPLSFRADLANDLKITQARSAFVLSSVETPFNVQLQEALNNEERTFRFVEVNADSLKDNVSITAQEIAERYELNKDRYKTEEQVAIEYVQLKRSDLAADQAVEDEELQAVYQDYVEKEREAEQRDSSHILVEVNDDRDDAAAAALAADIKSRVDSGEDFAVLAKELSDDIGTKNQGGALGLNTRGAFVEAFEAALYALEKDQVSEPVKTEFGYHVIRLNSVVAADVKSFDDMKGQMTNEIRNEKAAAQLAELQQELSNVAFSAGSIAEVAEVMGLKVSATELFSRAGGSGVAQNSEIRKLAFEDNILLDREISAAVETADGVLVFAVSQHAPAEVKPLDEVKAGVVAELTAEKSKELAKNKAEAIVSGGSDAEWKTISTSYGKTSDAPRAVQQKAFELEKDKAELVTTAGGYSVVVVDAINTKQWQDMQTSNELVEQGRTQKSRGDMVSYQGWAKDHTDINRSGS